MQFKKILLSAKNLVLAITLQRDIGSGKVRQGPGHTVIVDYELHPSDKKSIVAALKGLIQILISSGAERVSTMHDNDQGFDIKLSNDTCVDNLTTLDLLAQKSVQKYLQMVEKLHMAMNKHETLLLSAHQMGTCRFGVTPRQSACDENGELWECDNLYVTDTSIFPTASGSNPMVTVLTLSNMLSSRLVKRLKYEDCLFAHGHGNISGATSKKTEGLQLLESRLNKRVGENTNLSKHSCTRLLCVAAIGIVLAFVVHRYERN
jgi:long-chain-alcohol oxidase